MHVHFNVFREVRLRISIFQVIKLQVAVVPSLLAAVNTLREAVKIDNAVLVEGAGDCGKTMTMLFSE